MNSEAPVEWDVAVVSLPSDPAYEVVEDAVRALIVSAKVEEAPCVFDVCVSLDNVDVAEVDVLVVVADPP